MSPARGPARLGSRGFGLSSGLTRMLRRARDQHGVAVGRALRDELGGEARARARLVVDHDRLAERALQRLLQRARHDSRPRRRARSRPPAGSASTDSPARTPGRRRANRTRSHFMASAASSEERSAPSFGRFRFERRFSPARRAAPPRPPARSRRPACAFSACAQRRRPCQALGDQEQVAHLLGVGEHRRVASRGARARAISSASGCGVLRQRPAVGRDLDHARRRAPRARGRAPYSRCRSAGR